MNDLDTGAIAHAVDSLLNYETVKYFGAEDARGARATTRRWPRYVERGGHGRKLARLAQHRPVADHQPDDGAARWRYIVWGWSWGSSPPATWCSSSTLLAQLFRPLDMLGMGLSHDPPGPDRHGAACST